MTDRPRHWVATFMPNSVVLRQVITPDPGEVVVDIAPTVELTLADWQAAHGDYDLTIDGRDRPGALADRAARIRLRTKAQADPDFAALLRLLRVDPNATEPPPDSVP